MARPTRYTLADIKTTPRGAVTADLVEDGVIIAHLRRPASEPQQWVHRFLSDRAKVRFSCFCDSLSFDEAFDMLHRHPQGV
jgi:hypothetical protein